MDVLRAPSTTLESGDPALPLLPRDGRRGVTLLRSVSSALKWGIARTAFELSQAEGKNLRWPAW